MGCRGGRSRPSGERDARDQREDSGIDHAEVWGRLNNEHKPAEITRRKQLMDQVAADLGSLTRDRSGETAAIDEA